MSYRLADVGPLRIKTQEQSILMPALCPRLQVMPGERKPMTNSPCFTVFSRVAWVLNLA